MTTIEQALSSVAVKDAAAVRLELEKALPVVMPTIGELSDDVRETLLLWATLCFAAGRTWAEENRPERGKGAICNDCGLVK